MESPSTSPSVEDALFDAMDRQALRFIEMLDSDEKDEDGFDKVSIELKLKLFDKGQEWLKRRKVLRPDKESKEGEGIKHMREWINDPNSKAALRSVLFEAGVVLEPEKKNGRPTREEAVVRQRYKEAKAKGAGGNAPPPDSGWQAMLSEGEDAE